MPRDALGVRCPVGIIRPRLSHKCELFTVAISFQKSPAGKALLKARDIKVQYLKLVHNDVPLQLKEIVQHYLGVVTGYVQWKTADPAEAARLHFETPHSKLTGLLTEVEECSKAVSEYNVALLNTFLMTLGLGAEHGP